MIILLMAISNNPMIKMAIKMAMTIAAKASNVNTVVMIILMMTPMTLLRMAAMMRRSVAMQCWSDDDEDYILAMLVETTRG